jgi:hypothetical protein
MSDDELAKLTAEMDSIKDNQARIEAGRYKLTEDETAEYVRASREMRFIDTLQKQLTDKYIKLLPVDKQLEYHTEGLRLLKINGGFLEKMKKLAYKNKEG